MARLTRTCKRCGVKQHVGEFSPEGYICMTCKRAAVEKRETRSKYAGYTPAVKRAIYKHRGWTGTKKKPRQ